MKNKKIDSIIYKPEFINEMKELDTTKLYDQLLTVRQAMGYIKCSNVFFMET